MGDGDDWDPPFSQMEKTHTIAPSKIKIKSSSRKCAWDWEFNKQCHKHESWY